MDGMQRVDDEQRLGERNAGGDDALAKAAQQNRLGAALQPGLRYQAARSVVSRSSMALIWCGALLGHQQKTRREGLARRRDS